MEKAKLMDVRFIGSENVQEFAMSILLLTNLKSSVKESVLEVTTFEGSNHIAVTMYKEFYESNKSKLIDQVGAITHTTEQILFGIEFDDIDNKIVKEMDKQLDKYLDDEDEKEPEPFAYLLK
jgi:hypothetical protein